MVVAQPKLPLCWGHRGASADFPENTLASFESAARAGADGIETDVHITSDDYLLMFHDPELGRTTQGGKGSINAQPYKGNIEFLKTNKLPEQQLPTFDETIEWLVKPENRHITLHLDLKANNPPERLFTLMRKTFSRYVDWEHNIGPRIVLGIWHPAFMQHAVRNLPQLKRCYIGIEITLASNPTFWDNCHAFSIAYPILATSTGQSFLRQCKDAKKEVYTWTLNRQEEWVESAGWGVNVVMTDKPIEYLAFRKEMEESNHTLQPIDPWFAWKNWTYYTFAHYVYRLIKWRTLERLGGPLKPYLSNSITPPRRTLISKQE
ncbi:PLC-like phosphodiesterase [Cantharellus anzutake]|uniref:PLC-like phosphodiesterase n=1 Tax=Cantharellus anzutake TaxID=1750568 RepID=UPI001905703A|nr:PLC-like phosphodiesterase [Cantharellus anzutake]KAF8330021.1 PLC-like phosphodiesterase [Cantharellus anzutake]